MADYIIFNGTDAEFTNVNAGGSDVPARSWLDVVTLTNTELAAVATLNGAMVMQTAPTAAEKGSVLAALIDNLVSDLDLSSAAKVELMRIRRSQEDMKLIANALA